MSLFAPTVPTATSFNPTVTQTTPDINVTLAALTNIAATNNAQFLPTIPPSQTVPPPLPQMGEPPRACLKNKSLDEITSQWADDVEKYKKQFLYSGSNIKKWDAILIEGCSKITRLITESKEAERRQILVGNALGHLETEQLDMEKLFDYYEAVLSDIEMESLGIQPTDVEREKIFDTIIKLNGKLAEMQTGAEDLITSLNNVSLKLEKRNTDTNVNSPSQVQ